MKKKLYKIAKGSAVGVIICFLTLNIFELVYRYNWIDFYKSELKALNSEIDLSLEKGKTILIFGDSFSANTNSWVNVLRDSLKDYNIINSSIPGTSVFHQSLFFDSRVNEFSPDQIIIQLYVGNDLIDYNRPTNWSKQSIFRNMYWSISDNWISLQYLNYKMGYFKSTKSNGSPQNESKFKADSYNHRTINYLNSDPEIIQNSIDVKGNMSWCMEELMIDLNAMIKDVKIPITIVLIPHCCQLNSYYAENMKKMGAVLNDSENLKFGFLTQLKNGLVNRSNVRIFNALPSLKNNDTETDRMYYQNDPHLNKKGQMILGDFILRNLKLI